MEELTLKKFEEAAEKVKEATLPTNLVYSEYFSNQTGNKVYLKPENMQYTGAYKVRGAYYKISTMSEEARKKGLITASAGNHAQGVAFAAKKYGVKATVVMPTTTPLIKVNRTKGYGAEVVLHGDVYDEACEYALKLAEEKGLTFVHPFDDLDVATGQGSIAMEIIKELPTVDYILVPVGGGGLALAHPTHTLRLCLMPFINWCKPEVCASQISKILHVIRDHFPIQSLHIISDYVMSPLDFLLAALFDHTAVFVYILLGK